MIFYGPKLDALFLSEVGSLVTLSTPRTAFLVVFFGVSYDSTLKVPMAEATYSTSTKKASGVLATEK